MMVELYIAHEGQLYQPAINGEIKWVTERAGVPGQLTFEVVMDGIVKLTEGDTVSFRLDGFPIFFGFIFIKKEDKDGVIKVTAYDQLRYLKNKDTYVYEDKTVGELLQMICLDFNMQCGELEDTGYKIASRVEDNTALFDMIQSAIDLTLQNTKELYVLYDDFGSITLKNVSSMFLDILIDGDTGENFDYTSSIDSDTYNKVKLIYDNEDTGKREVFIAQNAANMNAWGVLQYYDTIQKGENGKEKADALIELYNHKTRNLIVKNAFGDPRVRAGTSVVVQLVLNDMTVQNLMLVEKCAHTFSHQEHFMDLTLRGGEFIA